ncbi:MAG: T9SS type A sorting domain-containing protein [Bacteroidia bacterium]
MKKNKLFSFFFLFALSQGALAQNVWTKMANFPGTPRNNSVNFTIGHYAFVGMGNNGSTTYNDFYKWNQATNTWSAIPIYPGGGAIGNIAFAANGKGYVGMGEDASQNKYTDLYQYDTTSNSWTPKATFPGTARYSPGCFSVGHKAIVVCGSDGTNYNNESWAYDANANTWTQNGNPFPGGNLEALCTFSIGNKGYAGAGWDHSNPKKAFWKYNVNTDAWTVIPDFPVSVGFTETPNGFVIGTKGYICTGLQNVLTPSNTMPTGYAYDTISNSWNVFTSMGAFGIKHAYSSVFAIGNYGYVCTGQDTNATAVNDLWQYYPCSNYAAEVIALQSPEKGMKVYPNPSNGQLFFECSQFIHAPCMLIVTNLLGETIYSKNFTPTEEASSLGFPENVVNGIYILALHNSQSRISQKIILNR